MWCSNVYLRFVAIAWRDIWRLNLEVLRFLVSTGLLWKLCWCIEKFDIVWLFLIFSGCKRNLEFATPSCFATQSLQDDRVTMPHMLAEFGRNLMLIWIWISDSFLELSEAIVTMDQICPQIPVVFTEPDFSTYALAGQHSIINPAEQKMLKRQIKKENEPGPQLQAKSFLVCIYIFLALTKGKARQFKGIFGTRTSPEACSRVQSWWHIFLLILQAPCRIKNKKAGFKGSTWRTACCFTRALDPCLSSFVIGLWLLHAGKSSMAAAKEMWYEWRKLAHAWMHIRLRNLGLSILLWRFKSCLREHLSDHWRQLCMFELFVCG